MPYSATNWVNDTTPALNATNLNKLTAELISQASTQGISNTLPSWANGIAPAVTDATPWNEMERVAQAVATSLSLSYTPTSWQVGWTPARNAVNLNKLEAQAVANRAAIDAQGGTDKLTWAPPVLGAGGVSIVNFTLSNATRSSSTLGAGAGRDLLITNTEVLTGGITEIKGWRNVKWIGGELSLGVVTNGAIIPREISGVFHLEGVKFTSTVQGDACVVRWGTSTSTIRLQNCNFTVRTLSGYHSDCFQTQESRIGNLQFDMCTMTTDYQGFFINNEPFSGASNPDGPSQVFNTDIRRTNFNPRAGVLPNTWLFKSIPPHCCVDTNDQVMGPWTISDVWVPNSFPGNLLYPFTTFRDYAGAYYKYGSFILSDSQGPYLRWSTPSDTVPTGTYAGQACADCGITGSVRLGTHADFCTTAGLGYVSPGYL